jgi:pimeloyl-ACP methyl ester carboxylesterase
MSDKPFVFLLPGMLCDAGVWHSQIAALQPQYELCIPVFRGFDSFAAMALHVLTLAPARFSVVAHSMGGRVAMELLRVAPERIDQFILMDMGVHPVTAQETARTESLLALAAQGGLAAVAESWIPFMIHPARYQDESLKQAIRSMVLRNDVDDLRGQLQAAQDRPDQSLYLHSISHQVRIICGDHDNWNPPELHQRMHEALVNSQLEIIADCGHMAPMEKPAEVNALLLRWLQESPTQA